jgi:hypothetical protein
LTDILTFVDKSQAHPFWVIWFFSINTVISSST